MLAIYLAGLAQLLGEFRAVRVQFLYPNTLTPRCCAKWLTFLSALAEALVDVSWFHLPAKDATGRLARWGSLSMTWHEVQLTMFICRCLAPTSRLISFFCERQVKVVISVVNLGATGHLLSGSQPPSLRGLQHLSRAKWRDHTASAKEILPSSLAELPAKEHRSSAMGWLEGCFGEGGCPWLSHNAMCRHICLVWPGGLDHLQRPP